MAQFPNWAVGSDLSATMLSYMVPNIVTKASATSITSNATLANDSELTGISLTVGTWEVEVMLWASASAAGGNLKTGWTFTTGTLTGTPNRTTYGPAASGATAANVQTPMNISVAAYNASIPYFLSSTTQWATLYEMSPNFVVATTGTLSIQVAQATSNVNTTTIQPGSRVKCRRIG